MRIAILTQPLHNNYGGILQNYALQTVLKKMGHSPTTVNISYVEPKYPIYLRALKIIWRLIKKIKGDESIVFLDPKHQWQFDHNPGVDQKQFIKKHIDYIDEQKGLDSSFCDKNHYDAFVVGSDQVWRPRFSPCFNNYFLDFTESHAVRRIAYAVSFGTNDWEGNVEQTQSVIPYARHFDSVSVREKSGVKICKDVLGIDAECVLDPTLMLNKDEYLSLLSQSTKVHTDKYMAVYVLDMNPQIKELIKTICQEKNLSPIYIGNISSYKYPSVESWLEGIFNSDFVLTDSFHGTAFSIISHRQFLSIVNSGRGASRFESLLGSLNLLDHMIDLNASLPYQKEIDYSSVDKILDDLRKRSNTFLCHALL